MILKLRLAAVAATLACATSAVHALPTIFFGENQTPNQTVTGDPLSARDAFSGALKGVGTETFEAVTPGQGSPLPISFPGSTGNLTATLAGAGQVFETPSSAGRFNTSGATAGPVDGKWWYVFGAFEITFSSAISAFGFYGTDIGDFNGQVTLSLTDINDAVTTLNVGNTLNGNDGALLFWGFVDTAKSYKRISFSNTGSATDEFGFDDMIVGDAAQIVVPGELPEPSTLALVGLSLAGLAAIGRRR